MAKCRLLRERNAVNNLLPDQEAPGSRHAGIVGFEVRAHFIESDGVLDVRAALTDVIRRFGFVNLVDESTKRPLGVGRTGYRGRCRKSDGWQES
jgi:hypothetical protein